jgi:lipopolysaccharide biosynthesis regulator YciM
VSAWLLVAAVAAAGVAAILSWDRWRKRRERDRAMLKGVRSMAAGDPDAAIEALSDAARIASPEAVDTYLALGSLFRREGDLARAMRLHRNMLHGPELDPARRAEVERELAEDYRRSGMLDEAAEIYRRLAPADPIAAEGLRDVLADRGDLAGAAAVQRGLSGGAPDPVLAHLLAGAARAALERDPAEARALAGEALAADAESPDALLALGEVEAAAGAAGAAADAVVRALDREPRAAHLAWPALARLAPQAAFSAAVARAARAPADPGGHYLMARALHRLGRTAEAVAAAGRALELDRSGEIALALRVLLREAEAPGPDDLAMRHDLLVKALLVRAPPLRCARCGGEAMTRAFRCRRCGAFDPY